MESCELVELSFLGYPFTWSYGRQGSDNIQCRLDRTYSNMEFQNRFAPIQLTHLPRFGSDHAATMIQLELTQNDIRRKRARLFWFEECYTKDAKCEEAIKRCWSSGHAHCTRDFESIRSLDSVFEEYRPINVKKEIIKVEKQLQESFSKKEDQ